MVQYRRPAGQFLVRVLWRTTIVKGFLIIPRFTLVPAIRVIRNSRSARHNVATNHKSQITPVPERSTVRGTTNHKQIPNSKFKIKNTNPINNRASLAILDRYFKRHERDLGGKCGSCFVVFRLDALYEKMEADKIII